MKQSKQHPKKTEAKRKSVAPSKVLSEIEKIKKGREERRVKQEQELKRKAGFEDGEEQFLDLLKQIDTFRQSSTSLHCSHVSNRKNLIGSRDKPTPLDLAVRVCIRKRPLNDKERRQKDFDMISTTPCQVHVHEPKTKVDLTKYLETHSFQFDQVFDENASNTDLYNSTCRTLAQAIFKGQRATCFAYGQTGSGKTYTMSGVPSKNILGLYESTARDIFKTLHSPQYKDLFDLYVNYFEIYGGRSFDLLNSRKPLRILEDKDKNVQVVGILEKPVKTLDEFLNNIAQANKLRSTGSTSANADSSRSHAILNILLRHKKSNKNRKPEFGKFSLVDLAGSERAADTSNSNRQARMEGAEINKSLLALKECIRAMHNTTSLHTPFRASKLTQVLKESFTSESCSIVMIACITCSSSSAEHTLNTLRYADRVKETAVRTAEHKPIKKLPPPQDTEPLEVIENPISGEDDLAYLHRSLRGDDQDNLLFTIHKTVGKIFEEEEDLLQCHREAIDLNKKLLSEEEKMAEDMNAGSSSNLDEYVDRVLELLDQKIDSMVQLKKKFETFRSHLKEEEEFSKKISDKSIAYF